MKYTFNKEKTISILGTSKTNELTEPYIKLIETLSVKLCERGYDIVTGGAKGINCAANKGACSVNPEKSFVIDANVVGIDFNQTDEKGNELYIIVAKCNNGAERTVLMNSISRIMIFAPGGTGTIEELGVTLEHIYYNIDNPPEKIILIGENFFAPVIELLNTMIKYGTIIPEITQKIVLIPFTDNDIQQSVNSILNNIDTLLEDEQTS